MAISEWFSNLVSTNAKFLPQTQGVVSPAKLHTSQNNTKSSKGLRIKFYGSYLVILPLGIRWALKKYQIKP